MTPVELLDHYRKGTPIGAFARQAATGALLGKAPKSVGDLLHALSRISSQQGEARYWAQILAIRSLIRAQYLQRTMRARGVLVKEETVMGLAVRLGAAPTLLTVLLTRQDGNILVTTIRRSATMTWSRVLPSVEPVEGLDSLQEGAAKLLNVPSSALNGASFTDVPFKEGIRRVYSIRLGDLPPGTYPGAWIPLSEARTALPPEEAALLLQRPTPTLTHTIPRPQPPKGGSTYPEEGLSLGELVSASILPCDIPPDVVLRPRVDHAALLGGRSVLPMTPEERAASRVQFPDPRALEPIGYQIRGDHTYAMTEDHRVYPFVGRLPPSLVVSLSPALAYHALQGPAPETQKARRSRDQALDTLLRTPDPAILDPDYQADIADRILWSFFCTHPSEAEGRRLWEEYDYPGLLALTRGSHSPVSTLIQQVATLRKVRTTVAASVGLNYLVQLPTSMLADTSDPKIRGLEKAYGHVVARQTVFKNIPEAGYLQLRSALLQAVPQWQAFSGSKEDKRTRAAWIQKAFALPDPYAASGTEAPEGQEGEGPMNGQELTAHQQKCLQVLAHRQDLTDYTPTRAWQNPLPDGRTFVAFTAEHPTRHLQLWLPSEQGQPAQVPVVPPQAGHVNLVLPAFLSSGSLRTRSNPASTHSPTSGGAVERMWVQGAPKGDNPTMYPFQSGLPSSAPWIVGTNKEWQDALMEAQRWVLQGIPDLELLRGPQGDACGAFACAYQSKVFPDYVLKFTGDPTDAAAWATVVAHRLSLPALAEVPYLFPIPGAPKICAIAQQRLDGLSPWEMKFFAKKMGFRYLLENSLGAQKAWDEAVTGFVGLYPPPKKKAKEQEARLRSNLVRLRRTITALKSVGIRLYDLHGGNIRKGPFGEWRITDMGISEGPGVEIPPQDLREVVKKLHSLGNAQTMKTTSRYTTGRSSTSEALPVQSLGHPSHPHTLYHGTTWDRLDAILRDGVRPRSMTKQPSSHNTGTKTATFWTDDLSGALTYAHAGRGPAWDRANLEDSPVIIELDAHDVPMQPDVDDTLQQAKEALKEVADLMGHPVPLAFGQMLPEDEVDNAIESLETVRDNASHVPLLLMHTAEGSFFAIDPIVRLPATSELMQHPELAESGSSCSTPGGIDFEDGEVFFTVRQYLYPGAILPSHIRRIWLPTERVANGLNAGKQGGPNLKNPTLCIADAALPLVNGDFHTRDFVGIPPTSLALYGKSNAN